MIPNLEMKGLSFKQNNGLPPKSPNNKWQIQNLNFMLNLNAEKHSKKRKFLLIDFLESLNYYGAIC